MKDKSLLAFKIIRILFTVLVCGIVLTACGNKEVDDPYLHDWDFEEFITDESVISANETVSNNETVSDMEEHMHK